MNEKVIDEIKKSYDLIYDANDQMFHIWIEHVLFTWRWWFGVLLAIVPWIIWILYRKRESTSRLMFAGVFSMLVAIWLDFIGIAYGKWFYKSEVLPFLPAYVPWDFCLIPVSIMFLIQYKPAFSPFIKALIFAGLTAFVAEPFFHWIELYDPVNWKHIYSFFIYGTIYLIAHWISRRKSFASLFAK